jgi:hypothetical protein
MLKFIKLIKAWYQNGRCSRAEHRRYHPLYDDTFQSFNIVDGRFFPPMVLPEN